MPARRSIITINEEKCNGCGLCVPACAEGAIQIVDGKARLVSEVYCDGLGACLGECPQGALTIEEREADPFDPQAVSWHLAGGDEERASAEERPLPCGCPGSASRVLEPCAEVGEDDPSPRRGLPSRLGNWPVQLHLVPVQAPYFDGADLLIAADCVPFAFADFHRRFLDQRTLLVGCPKLDDAEHYHQKLVQIFSQNQIESVEIAHMEVPCCFGLVHLVSEALRDSGKRIPLTVTKIGVRGEILETTGPGARSEAEHP